VIPLTLEEEMHHAVREMESLHQAGQFFHVHYQHMTGLIRQSASEWTADNAQRLGAALAFYTLLSLAPLVVLIVGVAALVFGRQAAAGQLAWEIRNVVGGEGAKAVQALVQNAAKPSAGIIATTLSVITLFLGASSVVVELRDDLNLIWKSQAAEELTGVRTMIRLLKERFFSFALVLGAGFVLLVLLVLSVWVNALKQLFGSDIPLSPPVLHFLTFVFSFAVITLVFGAIYKAVPDVSLKWSDVLVGASVTSLIFTGGKLLLGLYLEKAGFTSTYGAAGALVVLLVWVYYSAQLFFLGAEFTKVYAKTFGSHRPATISNRDPSNREPRVRRS
jgi:membrane protein